MAICMDCIKYLGYKLSLGQSPSVPSAQTGSKPKHEYVFPCFLPISCNYQIKTLVPRSGKGGGICRSYAKVSVSIASSEFCCALISWDEALANFRLSRLSLLKEIAGIFPARQFGINFFFSPKGNEYLLGTEALSTSDEHPCAGCTNTEHFISLIPNLCSTCTPL